MGNYFSSMLQNIMATFGPKQARILMLGLDAAGKTTMLYRLKLGEVVTTIPTIGFNVESVRYQNIEFTMWDVGGQDRLRPLLSHYLQNTQGIIYAIDSADRDRIDEAKERLNGILKFEVLNGVPIVVLANKQDLPDAIKPSDLTPRLDMPTMKGRNWHVQPCCATSGDGLLEGLDWLAKEVNR